jgi:hypothetical protein
VLEKKNLCRSIDTMNTMKIIILILLFLIASVKTSEFDSDSQEETAEVVDYLAESKLYDDLVQKIVMKEIINETNRIKKKKETDRKAKSKSPIINSNINDNALNSPMRTRSSTIIKTRSKSYSNGQKSFSKRSKKEKKEKTKTKEDKPKTTKNKLVTGITRLDGSLFGSDSNSESDTTFKIGDNVKMRNKYSDDWEYGNILCTNPLKIQRKHGILKFPWQEYQHSSMQEIIQKEDSIQIVSKTFYENGPYRKFRQNEVYKVEEVNMDADYIIVSNELKEMKVLSSKNLHNVKLIEEENQSHKENESFKFEGRWMIKEPNEADEDLIFISNNSGSYSDGNGALKNIRIDDSKLIEANFELKQHGVVIHGIMWIEIYQKHRFIAYWESSYNESGYWNGEKIKDSEQKGNDIEESNKTVKVNDSKKSNNVEKLDNTEEKTQSFDVKDIDHVEINEVDPRRSALYRTKAIIKTDDNKKSTTKV